MLHPLRTGFVVRGSGFARFLLAILFGCVGCARAEDFGLSQKQQRIFEEAQQFAESIQTQKTPLYSCGVAQNKGVTENPLHEPRVTNPENRIFIFVSFSMGETALMQYASEAKKAGASLVFRGLIGDSLKTTASRLQTLAQKTQVNFLIDPTLFKSYGIEKVPAVVVSDTQRFDVTYGQTTLDYALEKISKEGETASLAVDALRRLRSPT